jgi:hypothetical protein
MGYTDKTKQREYMKNLMAKRRTMVVIPVIPVIPDVIPISPHYYIQWTRRVFKLHREFYKSAWFARWKYELLQVHSQLISSLETSEEV